MNHVATNDQLSKCLIVGKEQYILKSKAADLFIKDTLIMYISAM